MNRQTNEWMNRWLDQHFRILTYFHTKPGPSKLTKHALLRLVRMRLLLFLPLVSELVFSELTFNR